MSTRTTYPPQTLEDMQSGHDHALRHAARCDVEAMRALRKWDELESLHGKLGAAADWTQVDRAWRVYKDAAQCARDAHETANDIERAINAGDWRVSA